MLKFSFNSNSQNWNVTLHNIFNPTVGKYIYAIKNSIKLLQPKTDENAKKTIRIYYKNKLIAFIVIQGDEVCAWAGNPRLFWTNSVIKCEMTIDDNKYDFKIYSTDEKNEVNVIIHPSLPKLIASVKKHFQKKKVQKNA